MRFEGVTVAVTGAGGGIGVAVVQAFAAAGAAVLAADIDPQGAECAAEAAAGLPGDARALAVDVTDPESMGALIAAAGETGGLDALVHAPAINKLGRFLDYDVADCRRILEVNVVGTFLACQAAARAMVARGRGGRIVVIGSNTGFRGSADRPAYGASKAAVAQLCQTMALELAPHGIAVNTVAPGPIDTPMTAWQPPGIRRAQEAVVPEGRYGRPEEVANAVLFLADPATTYVNGHVLAVDGGFAGAGLIRPDLDVPREG